MASKNCVEDPLMYEVVGEAPELLHKAESLNELVDNNFEGNKDLLWEYLLSPGTNDRFICYLDFNDYLKLQIQYWKSVLQDLSEETCYLLHEFHIQDLKIKSISKSNKINESIKLYLPNLEIMEREEFNSLYHHTDPSGVLKKLPYSDRSFEYLLACHLSKGDGAWSNAFNDKLKYQCWKLAVDEINILRSEVMRGVYDYLQIDTLSKRKIRDISENIEDIVQILKTDPKYIWLLDEEVIANNSEYLKSCYSYDTFSYFIDHQDQKYSIHDKENSDKKKNINQVIELTFKDKYLELLKLDIDSGFGSFFFSAQDNHKVNSLLLSHLYGLFRENKTNEIKRFMAVDNGL